MFERYLAKRRLNAVHKLRHRDFRLKRENGELVDFADYQAWVSLWDLNIDPLKDDYDRHVTDYWEKKTVDKLV